MARMPRVQQLVKFVFLKHYGTALIILGTVIILASLFWNIAETWETAKEYARIEAVSSYNKDLVYRRWIINNGGVYAFVSKNTPPNPYLAHVRERDITTPSGRTLTLINSSYMTRQVFDLSAATYGVRGRISSLRPLNPQNTPDAWERASLLLFKKGAHETGEVVILDRKPHYRYMRPFIGDEYCIKCHGIQGYRPGDIMGGISTAVPMEPYYAVARSKSTDIFLGHALIWLFGCMGIVIGTRAISRQTARRDSAEKTLRASESRYRGLHESMMDAFARVDMTGKVIEFNQPYRDLLGYSEQELLALTYIELTPERWRQYEARIIAEQVIPHGTSDVYEKEYRRKDGTLVPIELRVQLIRDERGNPSGMWGIVRDITERKKTEKLLRESERKYRTLLENLPGMAYRCRNDRDLTMEFVSDGCIGLTGYRPEDLIDNRTCSYHSITHPDDRELVWKTIQAALAAKSPYTLTYRIITASAREKWVWEQGRGIFVSDTLEAIEGFITDITESKRSEEALRSSEEKFSKSFTYTPVAFAIIAFDDGRYIDVNPNYEKMSGYTRDELIGRPACKFNVWADPEQGGELRRLLERDQAVTDYEYEYRRKNGETGTGMLSASCAEIGGEKCIISQTIDITARKLAETKIRLSLQEKETLLKEIYHRVKNNMQVIMSLLNLQGAKIEDENARKHLLEARNRIRAMSLLHEKLYQTENIAFIDFANYLTLIARELKKTYTGDIEKIEFRYDMERLHLGIDQAIPCGLIVNELVSNALKYAFPPGYGRTGVITITLKERDGQTVELSVSDNGIGLPEEFDINRTPSLGLALVPTLARQLNGDIRLDRSGGTSYTIRFPKKPG